MNNKALFVLLGMAVFSTTGARLLSVWNGRQPYPNQQQLARTIDCCPDARDWLAQHAQGGPITNDAYGDLAEWTVARETEQARAFVASRQPITCRALKDWREPT